MSLWELYGLSGLLPAKLVGWFSGFGALFALGWNFIVILSLGLFGLFMTIVDWKMKWDLDHPKSLEARVKEVIDREEAEARFQAFSDAWDREVKMAKIKERKRRYQKRRKKS